MKQNNTCTIIHNTNLYSQSSFGICFGLLLLLLLLIIIIIIIIIINYFIYQQSSEGTITAQLDKKSVKYTQLSLQE